MRSSEVGGSVLVELRMSSLSVWAIILLSVLTPRTAVGSPAGSPVFNDVVSAFESRAYDDTFREIWGNPRKLDTQGQHIELTLDRSSFGGGFISQDRIYHGVFSASIMVPGNYSAGVVTAFYTSNEDLYPKTHDEFDFEFLGVLPGSTYILQTNIYGDGKIGREERLHLWFDPTKDYHQYSIFWNQYHTVFYVDNIPVREMVNRPELGAQYPSKAQALYTTLWDGSNWATDGGKYPVNYDYAPYKAFFKDLKVEGCVWNSADELPPCASTDTGVLNKVDSPEYKDLTDKQRKAMKWVRDNHMFYSYCNDVGRYPVAPVDCPSRHEGIQKPVANHRRRSRKGRQGRKMSETVPLNFDRSSTPTF